MKVNSTIVQLFCRTSINPEQVGAFLLSLPCYREKGYDVGVGPQIGKYLNYTDDFEYELRQYLAGEAKTQFHLNKTVRRFLALNEQRARTMIRFSLKAVEATLLENEWYEVMPRYKKAQKSVERDISTSH